MTHAPMLIMPFSTFSPILLDQEHAHGDQPGFDQDLGCGTLSRSRIPVSRFIALVEGIFGRLQRPRYDWVQPRTLSLGIHTMKPARVAWISCHGGTVREISHLFVCFYPLGAKGRIGI